MRAMTPECTAAGIAARKAARTRRLETGDFVPNEPFRDRVLWLQAHDPDFSLGAVCLRLAENGYPKFVRSGTGTKKRSRKFHGDTTHLLRLLGMRDQASTFKRGRRYTAPDRTSVLPYEFAVALCRALFMDPVDGGV